MDSERIPPGLKIANVVDMSQIGEDVDSVSDILDTLAFNPTPILKKLFYPGSMQLAAERTGAVGVQPSEAPSDIDDPPACPRIHAQSFVGDFLDAVPAYVGALVAEITGVNGLGLGTGLNGLGLWTGPSSLGFGIKWRPTLTPGG